MEQCFACELTKGKLHLPGGRVYSTEHWVVEHCAGPLGVGTLVVKPFRHCLHFWELNREELRELSPLMGKVSEAIQAILNPDQVYVCLWSHASWEAVHIHFVLQPVWNSLKEIYPAQGPFLQAEMLKKNIKPPEEEVEVFCNRAREILLK